MVSTPLIHSLLHSSFIHYSFLSLSLSLRWNSLGDLREDTQNSLFLTSSMVTATSSSAAHSPSLGFGLFAFCDRFSIVDAPSAFDSDQLDSTWLLLCQLRGLLSTTPSRALSTPVIVTGCPTAHSGRWSSRIEARVLASQSLGIAFRGSRALELAQRLAIRCQGSRAAPARCSLPVLSAAALRFSPLLPVLLAASALETRPPVVLA